MPGAFAGSTTMGMHELPLFWLAAFVSRAGLVLLFVALMLAVRGRRQRPSMPAPLARPRTSPAATPILASEAERDATAGRLSQAIAEGRLGIDEGRDRIDAALSARHRHELAALTADLPPALAPGAPPTRPSRWPAAAIATGALVVSAVALGAAGAGANVAVLLLIGLAIVAIGHSRRRRAER